MRRLLIAVLLAALPAVARADSVRVSAAASLTDAFGEIARLYEQAHPGDTVELNFAGSQVLRTQIEQGAPVDVFASADRVQADALKAAGLLGAVQVFAHNRIVVVVPADDSRVKTLTDLTRPGLRIVVAGPTVPVGRYTAEVLARLGDDFRTRVVAGIVSQETSVRAVLAKVALGEADAGFVYATDALTAPAKVRVIDVPDAVNVVAEYPIGILARSTVPRQAEAFVAFVRSAEGQAVLQKHGFTR
jgi:molybdate transport system substrate-binding protein